MKIPLRHHEIPATVVSFDPKSQLIGGCDKIIADFYKLYGDTHVIDVEHKMESGVERVVLKALCIVRFVDGQQIIGASAVRAQIAQSEEAEAYNRTKPVMAVAAPGLQGKPGPRSLRDM